MAIGLASIYRGSSITTNEVIKAYSDGAITKGECAKGLVWLGWAQLDVVEYLEIFKPKYPESFYARFTKFWVDSKGNLCSTQLPYQ